MATSQLKQAIRDLKARVLSDVSFSYCAVFNNQVKDEIAGKTFDFPKPAVLIEIQSPSKGVQLLGMGVTLNDFILRFFIVHEQLNAVSDGTPGSGMDENLEVFDLRDSLKTLLTGFQPTNCSHLQYDEESLDYEHGNIYVYGVSFKCSYVDTKGSPFDIDSEVWQTINPPINLDLQGYITTAPAPPHSGQAYGWKDCRIYIQIVATPDPTNTQRLSNGDVIPVEYALNDGGTVTIPELISYPGIEVLTPVMINSRPVNVVDIWNISNPSILDNSVHGGINIGNKIEINATLPLYTTE